MNYRTNVAVFNRYFEKLNKKYEIKFFQNKLELGTLLLIRVLCHFSQKNFGPCRGFFI